MNVIFIILGGNCADGESSSDDSTTTCSKSQNKVEYGRKYRANSLFTHPLFKSNLKNDNAGNSDSNDEDDKPANDIVDTTTTPNIEVQSSVVNKIEKTVGNVTVNSSDEDGKPICLEIPPKISHNRRDSIESGFFSCFNEDSDAMTTTPANNKQLSTNVTPKLPSSVAASASAVASSLSLRSFDDLELLADKHNFSCFDIDAAACCGIDMDLINRLALDSEIHSFIQKSQLTNTLLYCKNRTSSIYTDSSDDISSLAGSDSLLWDDRSFTHHYHTHHSHNLPQHSAHHSTRSAQIAKIVEYFERKGQTLTANKISSIDHHRYNHHYHQRCSGSSSSSSGVSSASSFRFDYLSNIDGSNRHAHRYGMTSGSSAGTSTTASIAGDYEAFCFELVDKKPPSTPLTQQQRLTICEGAVKSKLQIFDKPKQKESNN